MAGYETFTWNAYESTTLTSLNPGDPEVTVQSAPIGLNAPVYLVLEPDTPTKREYVLVTAIAGPVFTISRGLEGSAEGVGGGGGGHLANVKIRAIFTHQNLEDIWDAIVPPNGIEQSLLNHITDGGDPHAQAGYLTEIDADLLYVQLDGGNRLAMTGYLKLFANPVQATDAATKDYVDVAESDAEAAAKAYSDSLDHDHATPIAAHNTDAGAHTNLPYLKLTGGTISGNMQFNSQVIFGTGAPVYLQYAEANPNAGVPNIYMSATGKLHKSTSIPLSEADANARYLNVAGDTMTGILSMGGHTLNGLVVPQTNDAAATKAYVDERVEDDVIGVATGGIHTDTSLPAVTSATEIELTHINITRPAGWGSTRVVARAFIQYAGCSANAQMRARIQIDSSIGAQITDGVRAASGDPACSPTHGATTADSDIKISVRALDAAAAGLGTGRYITLDYALYRMS